MIRFIKMGADIATPSGPPTDIIDIPIPRFSLGSHFDAAVIAKEYEGPSPAPKMILVINKKAKLDTKIVENCTRDQRTTIPAITILVPTRSASAPPNIAEREYNKKNTLPTMPHCSGVKPNSSIIETDANPIMALSALLITVNKNSSAMTIHAFFVIFVSFISFLTIKQPPLNQLFLTKTKVYRDQSNKI